MRSRRLREAPECELKGIYQEQNQQTAYVALQTLRNYAGINIQRSAVSEGFAYVCQLTGLRGRWETLREKPLVLCDTGHNSHGIQYVARQLKELPHPEIYIIFGMVNDKDTDVVMRLLPSSERFRYIFTTPNTLRARPAQEMLTMWKASHGIPLEGGEMAIDDPREAIAYALSHATEDDAIFIGGSNYLVGDAISYFTH